MACVVVGVLFVLVIFLSIPINQAFADIQEIDLRLLIIVGDTAQKPSIDEEQAEMIECKTVSEISESDNNHIAYAAMADIAESDKISSLFRYAFSNYNARIYIYGALTISDFKNILGISTYSVETDIYDEKGKTDKKATLTFSEEQEDNKIEQIISLSKNPEYQSLIASVPMATTEKLEHIIIEHYINTFVNPLLYSTTIVSSHFDYRNYAYLGGTEKMDDGYVSMDCVLYRLSDESDSEYDYFAIKVNATPVCSLVPCSQLQVKLALRYSTDHFIEYGPSSTNRADSINVQLGFGVAGFSGGVGFTFAPGTGPTVTTTYSPADRSVLWKVDSYWLVGKPLNDAMYPFGASWASLQSRRKVFIEFSNRAAFSADHIYATTNWHTVGMCYSY